MHRLARAPGPLGAVLRFLDLPYGILLESTAPDARGARWSFFTADPFAVLREEEGRTVLRTRAGEVRVLDTDPFGALRDLLAGFRLPSAPHGPPFQGGAAGYFGYEVAGRLERLPPPPADDLGLPEFCVGLYDWVLAWDHARRRVFLVSTGLPEAPGPARARRAAERAGEVLDRLKRPGARPGHGGGQAGPRPGLHEVVRVRDHGSALGPGAPRAAAASADRTRGDGASVFPVDELTVASSTFTRDAYLAAVQRVRDYILAGDVFQANLSQRLQAPFAEHPLALYARLRRRNPAPFAAYFDLGDGAVVSASPERFLRHRAGRVETRPIKGTAPRGADPARDRALAEALAASAKDRAENVMIVDLLRNDLSTVCADHSVRVTELCRLEHHPTVHHLVSTIVGRLREGLGPLDALRALFPGGSITGAPKVRAMEILRKLEPTRRGVYTGALGYVGFDGAMDTSIAIRTFTVTGGTAYFHVGGGVTLDSEPEREYAECLDKARGLAAALAGGAP